MERRPRDQQGAAAVEFALVLPLLVLMLCAIIDFGARYQYSAMLNNAAGIAARDMSINDDVARARSAGVSAGAPSSGWRFSSTSCPANGNVTVSVTTDRATATRMFGTTFSVTGRGVARCQR